MEEKSGAQEISSVFELIGRVHAWSPSMPTAEHWSRWVEGESGLDPFFKDESLPQSPDVSFLPIALRKRLSAISKVSLHLMQQTVVPEELSQTAIVMSSRFGEAQTTVELLESIAREEESSPMAFSRSVHNSSVGLFSIAQHHTQPNTAVAAMEYSFGMGLIEAILQLYRDPEDEEVSDLPAPGPAPVLYVYADEAIPEVYRGFVTEPPVNFGAAFLLEPKPTAVPLSELITGLAEIECIEFLQFALASS